MSAVGSGVVALRLREADLPTEPVVALMSTEHRFAIGAGILAAPLLAASIGFLADSVWGQKTGWPSGRTIRFRFVACGRDWQSYLLSSASCWCTTS